ncbi:hypothetical protein PROFUN_11370 [Planoprotostelium fungivorum]|uniref:Uncharacterized protein n=1 Tax=Planoprotostelium fungivorum TaxID=1890364 RepID=A0A2P6N2Z0_9EUKA|nr:hypothetical protein PROFUN_11370 [Planoprotostelium fungivorum]
MRNAFLAPGKPEFPARELVREMSDTPETKRVEDLRSMTPDQPRKNSLKRATPFVFTPNMSCDERIKIICNPSGSPSTERRKGRV